MTNGVLENSLLWETKWVEKGIGATLEVGVKMDGRPKHKIRPRDLIKCLVATADAELRFEEDAVKNALDVRSSGCRGSVK
jgi:hypothetical protein